MENTQRIIAVSRKLRITCKGLIICLPVIYGIFWTFFNQFYNMGPLVPLPVRVDHDLPRLTRSLAFLVDMIPMMAIIYGLRKLEDLFRLYEKGLIFTEQHVRCFRSLGRTLIVWVGCDVLRNSLLSMVLTLDKTPGTRVITVGLGSADFAAVFVGIVVVILSWVMDEGRKIQEDQALIV
jgi:heme/copper-type cytochrome/quinol oxidase subunit 4